MFSVHFKKHLKMSKHPRWVKYPRMTMDAGQTMDAGRWKKGFGTGNFQPNPECQELKDGAGSQFSFLKPVTGPKKASQVSAEAASL